MRAVRFDEFGGPQVLHVAEVERPAPGEGQVLIAVKAAGINPFDSKVREGQMQEMINVKFPSGQGSDVAGVVEQVGAGVGQLQPGDEVLGATTARGSQAQYALVKAERVVRKPSELSWETAGAVNTVCTTAYAMVAAVGVTAGETVLISAAAGGVGSVACQLAVSAGATVIGVASERNHDWLRAHGVIPIAYDGDLKQRIADVVAQGRVDALLDAHGGGYVQLGIELGVSPERIDTIADQAGAAEHLGVKTDGGFAAPMPQALQEMTDRIAAGEIELPIERVFPMDEVVAAYELLEQGHAHGKVVLIP